MSDNSKIEWTDATWNPVTGCSVVSPGCTNCYAMKLAGTRLKNTPSRQGLTRETKAGPVWNGQVRFNGQWLDQPLRWRRPRKIFVCAHGDLFAENVPDDWIDRVFAVMALSPQHTFQVLTKRADRMRAYVSGFTCDGARRFHVAAAAGRMMEDGDNAHDYVANLDWPLPNVWLGVSAEDQTRADQRIPELLATPAAVRFVSLEPLLGPIDLRSIDISGDEEVLPLGAQWLDRLEEGETEGPRLDWVIVGGESGPDARPMHPDWARSLRDQCAAAGTPFFFKQWGNWLPISHALESDDLYHPAPASHPDARRRCRHASLVLHADGAVFNRDAANDFHRNVTAGAYAAGSGCMMMFDLGKRTAGRLLDGVEHNGWPG